MMMLGSLVLVPALALAGDAAGTVATPVTKATAALDSLWSTFWSTSEQYLLREVAISNSTDTADAPALLNYWNYQEAIHAMALGASIDYTKYGPRLKSMIAGQAAMNSQRQPGTGDGPGPAGKDGWTRPYFDDMNWAELALLAAHDAAVNAGDKAFAESLLIGASNTSVRNIFGGVAVGRSRRPFPQTISSAWDTADCGGGIFWDRQKTQKATASNAGPALSSVLFANALNVTKSTDPEANWREAMAEQYEVFGATVYHFWNATMTDATTGQVIDHYIVNSADGTCSRSSPTESFTYNEGLMLGAATVLGNEADAARFATRLSTAHVKPTDSASGSPVLFDGCEVSCTGFDCPSFKGVAVRELARWIKSPIATKLPTLHASAKKILANSAAAVWNNARADGQTGPLFSATWAKSASPACSKYNAAAHVSAVFALFSQVDVINEPTVAA